MNDRQRVEVGIIPALIYGIVRPLEADQQTDDERRKWEQIVTACRRAMEDPVDDLIEPRRSQIFRRTDRTYRALAEVLDGTSNAQAAMATYYLLESLIQEDRISIYEDSYFGQAMLVFMESIQGLFEIDRLDAAAQKRARQLRDTLRVEGYFR